MYSSPVATHGSTQPQPTIPMSIPHNTTPTGQPNQYRVIFAFGEWKAQGTDNNNVWQSLDYGVTYDTQEEAEAAAQEWAERNEGEYIGVEILTA
jgi:hypothetical protein